MNLKTSLTTAIELGNVGSDDNIELLGVEPLKLVNQALYFAIENKDITPQHTFKSTFGPDVLFFYALEQVKNNSVIKYERGIGYYFEQNNKSFLKRHIPIATGSNSQNSSICSGGCTKFNCTECDHLIVYSTVPITYAECLIHKNSIITSANPFQPHSFVVEENSLVGRLGDNVGSISLEDKNFIDSLVSSICQFSKQIVLKTSKLICKRAQVDLLDFLPSSNPQAKKGSIYYDNDSNALKVYDGNKWKTLSYVDEDSE